MKMWHSNTSILALSWLVFVSVLLPGQSRTDEPLGRILSTANVYAKTTGSPQKNPTEDEILAVAKSFLMRNRSKRFRYLRESSFTVGQEQPGVFKPLSLNMFVSNVEEVRRGGGCQVEVLGILNKEGLRWVCSDGRNGRRVIHGGDPFTFAGGDLLFSVVQPSGGMHPGFKAYVLSNHPAIDAVEQTLSELKSIEGAIDWRIVVVGQPWYHVDGSFSSRNPNLLLYSRPSKSNVNTEGTIHGLYWTGNKAISTRADP